MPGGVGVVGVRRPHHAVMLAALLLFAAGQALAPMHE